jgi:hypothetical protein
MRARNITQWDEKIPGNKEMQVLDFYNQNYGFLYRETMYKFKTIFKDFLNVDWAGENRLDLEEDIQGVFWNKIVEPGWSPDILSEFDNKAQSWGNDNESIDAYNLLWDKFYEIEKMVCEKLGIPPETVDI